MSDKSKIEWTDATVNFWWGCTKIENAPACEHCYAEAWDKRTGGAHWGRGAPRRKISSAAGTMRRLNRSPGRPRVFIQSMADLFDLEVDVSWFAEAWRLINECDRLRVQILTKRVSAVEKRLAIFGRSDWPQHAGLMITVVTQHEFDRDVPRLLALEDKLDIPWVGLSIEPMMEAIDLRGLKPDWIICGGESGPHARPFDLAWASSIVAQCKDAGVPCFVKQLGAKPVLHGVDLAVLDGEGLKHKKGGDWSEWPEDLRVRQFPEVGHA